MPSQPLQHNQVRGAPHIINGGPTQHKYPEQVHHGPGGKEQVQLQQNPPPAYKEQDFVNNSSVVPPNAAHTTPQTASNRFVGGFRPE
ncbi:hypothetical protein EST38_g7557 [Candolleomyces aberdarensis]|uniref:Uncharacterized protein n=1 Tax=Candolleomyces aberdarensis TaxID=2316362 RepID=A0A4Q2DEU8_9AGAR|nr:hypothetical protein EST38_g7557 [Candolleomyces aberdarensis]